jgi:hypothetical protein
MAGRESPNPTPATRRTGVRQAGRSPTRDVAAGCLRRRKHRENWKCFRKGALTLRRCLCDAVAQAGFDRPVRMTRADRRQIRPRSAKARSLDREPCGAQGGARGQLRSGHSPVRTFRGPYPAAREKIAPRSIAAPNLFWDRYSRAIRARQGGDFDGSMERGPRRLSCGFGW